MGYKGKLKSDTYLVPFAMVEYGLILKDQGHLEKANTYFEKAKWARSDSSLAWNENDDIF